MSRLLLLSTLLIAPALALAQSSLPADDIFAQNRELVRGADRFSDRCTQGRQVVVTGSEMVSVPVPVCGYQKFTARVSWEVAKSKLCKTGLRGYGHDSVDYAGGRIHVCDRSDVMAAHYDAKDAAEQLGVLRNEGLESFNRKFNHDLTPAHMAGAAARTQIEYFTRTFTEQERSASQLEAALTADKSDVADRSTRLVAVKLADNEFMYFFVPKDGAFREEELNNFLFESARKIPAKGALWLRRTYGVTQDENGETLIPLRKRVQVDLSAPTFGPGNR